ncbi:MAG: phosphodiester glycosidase family protein, partial [Bacteroidales bacterium]
MRKQLLSLILFLGVAFTLFAEGHITINGKDYLKKTLTPRTEVVPGVYSYSYSLPDFPLQVFFVETDLTRPELSFEAGLSHDSIRGTEQVLTMCRRKTTGDKKVIAAINADFFRNIKEKDPAGVERTVIQSCNGTMTGGVMGEVPSPNFGPMLGFCTQGKPYLGSMTYTGYVKRKYRTETLHNINTGRGANQMILYTPLIGKSTRSNDYGTEVILEMKAGFSLGTNKEVSCIVKKINTKAGNTPILPNQLILSGHGTSEEFLGTFRMGDEVKIRINIAIAGSAEPYPDFQEMLGSNTLVLNDGELVTVTSTAGGPDARHPRTAAGYSADKSKFYLCVVDGRTDVSAGLKQQDMGIILKDAGAAYGINFDGGGSSILAVNGEAFNNPAGGTPYR